MKTLNRNIVAALIAGVLTCGVASQHAQAVPITGSIEFDGQVKLVDGSGDTVTLDFGAARVDGVENFANDPTGDYSALSFGIAATFKDFTINLSDLSFVPDDPVDPVWMVVHEGITYRFRLDTITQASIPPSLTEAWSINGTGYASITGVDTDFEETFGTFSIGAGGNDNPTFHFTAGSAVPDGGATLALLGFAFMGVETFRRKSAKREGVTA